MANLHRSTLAADAAIDACACQQNCGRQDCTHAGQWHNHPDEVCTVHPDTIVD